MGWGGGGGDADKAGGRGEDRSEGEFSAEEGDWKSVSHSSNTFSFRYSQ